LEHGIEGEVSGRSKHLYSIYLKMERQGIEFDQVYDLIAFRIIVVGPRLLRHAGHHPCDLEADSGRFKDYIAMPKAEHVPVAAHHGDWALSASAWRCRSAPRRCTGWPRRGLPHTGSTRKGSVVSGRDDKRFGWLRQLLEWQQELKDSREFMDTVKIDLFPEEVYVFTPRGDVKELPKGSTPVDFAYSVHTDIGHKCVGAKINGKLVPLKTPLHNGDIVEVITSPNQTPSKDWLKFVAPPRRATRSASGSRPNNEKKASSSARNCWKRSCGNTAGHHGPGVDGVELQEQR
jgi:GTP diphosphokinase / guanosine-3',5'-bis(diphosphate) 3'-diphosphatase